MEKKYFEHISQARGKYVLCDPIKNDIGCTDNSFTEYPIQIIDVGLATVSYFNDAKPKANLHIRILPLVKFTKRKWYEVTEEYADAIRARYNKPEFCKTFAERKNKVVENINQIKIARYDTKAED